MSRIITSTYQYNHHNQRTKLVEGSDTTLYPFSSYHIENGTPKLYLSLGTVPVATIQGTTTAYLHTNHLTSTTKTTNQNGVITKTLDYLPYGSVRLEEGVQEETIQYTGYTKDYATDLNYAGQRYYISEEGRFMSQDPAFLDIGAPTFKEDYKRTLEQHLRNPQALNSYAYALNNPVKNTDKNGEIPPLAVIGYALAAYGTAETGINAYEVKLTHWDYPDQFTDQERRSARFNLGLDAVTWGVSKKLEPAQRLLFDGSLATADVADQFRVDLGTVGFGDTSYDSIHAPGIFDENPIYDLSEGVPYIGQGVSNSIFPAQQNNGTPSLVQVLREIEKRLNSGKGNKD